MKPKKYSGRAGGGGGLRYGKNSKGNKVAKTKEVYN